MLRVTRGYQLMDYLRSLQGSRKYGLQISRPYMALQWYNAFADDEGEIVYFIARRIDGTKNVIESYELDTDLIFYENGQYLYDNTQLFDGNLPDGVYFLEWNDGYDTYRTEIFSVTNMDEFFVASGAGLASGDFLVSSSTIEIPDEILLKKFEVESDYVQFEE